MLWSTEKTFFGQPVKINSRTYDSNWKIATGQGDDFTTSYLLPSPYFLKNKLIVIDLSKQQALDTDLKAIQQVNLTGNLARDPISNTAVFFIIEEAKENSFRFFTKSYKSIVILFCFNI